MYLLEATFEKIAQVLGRRYGVTVRFEGGEAYTNGKEIVLPAFSVLDDETRTDLEGYLDHETAHVRQTDFNLPTSLYLSGFHKVLTNCLEDVRIEKWMLGEYPGCRNTLGALREKVRRKTLAALPDLLWPARLLFAMQEAAFGQEPVLDAETAPRFALVEEEIWEVAGAKSTAEIVAIAERITKRLVQTEAEPPSEGKAESGPAGPADQGEPQGSDRVGSEKGPASAAGQDPASKSAEGKKGRADGAAGGEDSGAALNSGDLKGQTPEEVLNEIKARRMLVAPVDDEESNRLEMAVGGMGERIRKQLNEAAAFRVPPKPTHEPVTEKDVHTIPHIPACTVFDRVTDHSGKGDPAWYGKLREMIQDVVVPAKLALQRSLQTVEKKRQRGERETGRLDRRTITRCVTSPGNHNVFTQVESKLTDSWGMLVLLDLSGSMSHNNRIELARQTAIALGEILKGFGRPFEICGFASRQDHRVARYVKDQYGLNTSRFNRTREALDLHVFKSRSCGSLVGLTQVAASEQNPDGECLAWAAKRMLTWPEKRKILLVLSDGAPATGDGRDAILRWDLKVKVAALSRIGIEVVGIGIETNAVQDFYPEFVVVNQVADLPALAAGKLGEILRKQMKHVTTKLGR